MRGCQGRDNAGPDGAHPLTEHILADQLVVDVAKPYAEQGSFLEIELAAWRGEGHRTCGGRALNDEVMDTVFTLLVNGGAGERASDPRRHRPAIHARLARVPHLAPPNPAPRRLRMPSHQVITSPAVGELARS
jgi:hypothetical protein